MNFRSGELDAVTLELRPSMITTIPDIHNCLEENEKLKRENEQLKQALIKLILKL